MDKLEEYYNTGFKMPGMPEFPDLSPDDKNKIRNSVGFALWNASKALKEFSAAVREFTGTWKVR